MIKKKRTTQLAVCLIILMAITLFSCGRSEINPRYTENDSAVTDTKTDDTSETTQDGTDDGLMQDDTSTFTEDSLMDEESVIDDSTTDDTTGMDEELSLLEQEARDKFENDDIHFEYDSTRIDEIAQLILSEKAEWMANHPFLNITIEGHCDIRGTTEYNLSLGEKRASAAKQYLIDLGISDTRISTISYGEEKPVDLGESEAAWARNRRAHFVIR